MVKVIHLSTFFLLHCFLKRSGVTDDVSENYTLENNITLLTNVTLTNLVFLKNGDSYMNLCYCQALESIDISTVSAQIEDIIFPKSHI